LYLENNDHLVKSSEVAAAITEWAKASFIPEWRSRCSSFFRSTTQPAADMLSAWGRPPILVGPNPVPLGVEQFIHLKEFSIVYQGFEMLQFVRSTLIGDLLTHEVAEYLAKLMDIDLAQMSPNESVQDVIQKELHDPWLPLQDTDKQGNKKDRYNRIFSIFVPVPRLMQAATDALVDAAIWNANVPEHEAIAAAERHLQKIVLLYNMFWRSQAPRAPVNLPREVSAIQRYTSQKSRAEAYGGPSVQSTSRCFRCFRQGHIANDCDTPDSEVYQAFEKKQVSRFLPLIVHQKAMENREQWRIDVKSSCK
jgi:hypothetical protein